MVAHRFLAGSLLFCLTALVYADTHEPLDWLDRMVAGLHAQNYQGTFILQRGERIDTVRVIHAAENGGYRERLHTLTGTIKEVVRSVDQISTLKGARTEVQQQGQGGPQWPPAIAAALVRDHGGYALSSLGHDRIAGLPCNRLLAQAQDSWRFSHRYCIHKQTGFPLLSELLDADGQLLERMVFTEIEFLDAVAEDDLRAQHEHSRHIEIRATQPLDAAENSGLAAAWSLDDLPPGFVTVMVTQRDWGTGAPPSLHYVLSDGLATISVYMDRLENDAEMFSGVTRFGATHAAAQPVADHQITVVGEVPEVTVQAILESLRYQDGG